MALRCSFATFTPNNPNFFPLASSLFAPLLAGQALEEADDRRTIWQSSITENSSLNPWVLGSTRKVNKGLTQINVGQVGSFEQGYPKQGSSQISTTKIGTNQRTVGQIGVAEVGSTQISFVQNSLRHSGITKISPTEVSFFQPSTPQIRTTKISPAEISPVQFDSKQDSLTQVNARQFSISQSAAIQFNSTEIPFTSGIALQQFFSSHHFNLQNTTVPAWTSFLQAPTPFNLNLEVTDLPTGQLAEAHINSFDPSGRPTSGTLTLDLDGNSLGWYLDPIEFRIGFHFAASNL